MVAFRKMLSKPLKTCSPVTFAGCQAQFDLLYVLSRGVSLCDLLTVLPPSVLPHLQCEVILTKPAVSTTDLSVLPKLTLRVTGFQ